MSNKEALKRAQARYEAKGAVKAVTKGYYLKCHTQHDAEFPDKEGVERE